MPSVLENARSTRWSAARFGASWTAIVVCLIALNVAGFVYRPKQNPSELTRSSGYFQPFTDPKGEFPTYREDIPFDYVDVNDNTVYSPKSLKPKGSYAWRPRRIAFGTIIFRTDGGIVGYDGLPGETSSRRYWIRPPLRSFWAMWWPTFTAGAITVLYILVLHKQYVSRRTRERMSRDQVGQKSTLDDLSLEAISAKNCS